MDNSNKILIIKIGSRSVSSNEVRIGRNPDLDLDHQHWWKKSGYLKNLIFNVLLVSRLKRKS